MAFGNLKFDTLTTSGQIHGSEVSIDADYINHGSTKHWVLLGSSGNSVTDLNYTQQCHNNNDFVTGSCEIVSAYGHATTQGVFDYAYVTNQFVGDLA